MEPSSLRGAGVGALAGAGVDALAGAPAGAPAQEQKPSFEYTAQATSPFVAGEVKLAIGPDALLVAGVLDTVELPFAQVNALVLDDYVITVAAETGDFAFSRMGSWCQPFFDALLAAYNKAVLRALFVQGDAALTARGAYHYTEQGVASQGFAPVQVFENSVVVLPPNLAARRVPLVFVQALEKGDFELTLQLTTGERYTFAKLGYDTSPFAAMVEKNIRALREKSLTAVKELDPTLTATQASQVVKLLPEGGAAPLGRLARIAPSLVAAFEAKLAQTRAALSYDVFRELGDPARIFVGFKRIGSAGAEAAVESPDPAAASAPALAPASAAATASAAAPASAAATAPAPYLLWLIAPSPDGRIAAVEFAEENSATFVYRTGGDFTAFAQQLSRALEAIDFKREVIRLTQEELLEPQNASYYMGARRTAALQLVRSHFVGRIIHSNPQAWEQSLIHYFQGGTK